MSRDLVPTDAQGLGSRVGTPSGALREAAIETVLQGIAIVAEMVRVTSAQA